MDPTWSAPWFAPYRPLLAHVGDDALAGRWARCIEGLNALAEQAGLRNDNDRPVRFVDAGAAGGKAYEAHIWATGAVPTRVGEAGGWHDLFNALAWLTCPRTKSALNRIQARSIAADGVGERRGGLRDAATLFDENAALLVTADAMLVDALRRFDWHALFVAGRARFAANAQVVAFGHALVDKLRSPYKAICAHAWIVPPPPAGAPDWSGVDTATAASIGPAFDSTSFAPLPVLGIPGWWLQNESPSFYEDATVFRTGRRGPPPQRSAAVNG